MLSHINTIADVETFFRMLVKERRLSFNPDDDFSSYVVTSTQEPCFTPEEVELFNRLMDECFDVCQKARKDIYDLAIKVLQED